MDLQELYDGLEELIHPEKHRQVRVDFPAGSVPGMMHNVLVIEGANRLEQALARVNSFLGNPHIQQAEIEFALDLKNKIQMELWRR